MSKFLNFRYKATIKSKGVEFSKLDYMKLAINCSHFDKFGQFPFTVCISCPILTGPVSREAKLIKQHMNIWV